MCNEKHNIAFSHASEITTLFCSGGGKVFKLATDFQRSKCVCLVTMMIKSVFRTWLLWQKGIFISNIQKKTLTHIHQVLIAVEGQDSVMHLSKLKVSRRNIHKCKMKYVEF